MEWLTGLLWMLTVATTVGAGVWMFHTPSRERGPIDVSPRA